jgi:hypothetical protein
MNAAAGRNKHRFDRACRQRAHDFIEAAAPTGKSAGHVNIENSHDAFFAVTPTRADDSHGAC